MEKYAYMTKEEFRHMEICTSNDYIGVIKSAEWKDYLQAYKVTIEFEDNKELKQFCDMYNYKRLVGRNLLWKK